MKYLNCFPFHPDLEEAMRGILAQGFRPYEIIKNDDGNMLLNADMSYNEFRSIQFRAIGEMYSRKDNSPCLAACLPGDDGYECISFSDRYYFGFLGYNSFGIILYDKVKPYIILEEEPSDIKEVPPHEFYVPKELGKFVRTVLIRNFYPFSYRKTDEDIVFTSNADPGTFRKICARANCEKYGMKEKDNVRYFAEEELSDPAFMDSLWLLKKSDCNILPLPKNWNEK